MRTVLFITIFVAVLALFPQHANANTGWTIDSIAKSANLLQYLGLSVTHSSSAAGTRFVIEYRSTRGIVWSPKLVAIPDDKIGVLKSKRLKGDEGIQYSFTIAENKLGDGVFYLHNYQDGVVFVQFNLADIVESSADKSKERLNTESR